MVEEQEDTVMYIPPASPEDMEEILNSARADAMMREDPYAMNTGLAKGDPKIISLARNLNLDCTSKRLSSAFFC